MAFLNYLRRLIVVLIMATWWGGFTFYALAVIPSGHQVLRSHVRQGFITQVVTRKLNWLGVVTLALALTETLSERRWPRRFRVSVGAWLICVAAQASLFYLHPRMDALLDPERMEVIDDMRYETLHQRYLCGATIGWSGALILLALATSRPGAPGGPSTSEAAKCVR